MTTIATSWRSEGGQDILYMGEIVVGRAMATGGSGNKPRWLFSLKSYASWNTARSLERAKLEIEAELDRWLAKAGIA